MNDDVELLIAGGGLTGLLLGVACAGAGLAVAIVDRQDPAALLADDFDGRSSAIGYGSHKVLEAIGFGRKSLPMPSRSSRSGSPTVIHRYSFITIIANLVLAPRSVTSSRTAFSGAS